MPCRSRAVPPAPMPMTRRKACRRAAGAAELEQLVRALREPTEKNRRYVLFEHKENAEIARLVGRPPATVNSQLWRAKLLLRQQITERRQNE